jgi:hypothetical protein
MKGERGELGPVGPEGKKGDKGDKGMDGNPGVQGDRSGYFIKNLNLLIFLGNNSLLYIIKETIIVSLF